MTLINQIKQKINQTNHEELLKSMGYNNLERGRQTLRTFLKTDNIYLWLKDGSFDFKFNSEEFLRALFNTLNIPSSEYETEIQKHLHRIHQIAIMEQPYIRIDTLFKRTTESILVLVAMGSKTNFSIDKELLLYKSNTEIFEIVGSIIREHYISNNGSLKFWGKIYYYQYFHTNGKKYIFNTEGILLDRQDIMENSSEIILGN